MRELESLRSEIGDAFPNQAELDRLVERRFSDGCQPTPRSAPRQKAKTGRSDGNPQILRLWPEAEQRSRSVPLALLDLAANAPWSAKCQIRSVESRQFIEFIAEAYALDMPPNTRETIRDEAVKYFVETGLLLRNPDNPSRPTNSGQTVYQIEPTALGAGAHVRNELMACAVEGISGEPRKDLSGSGARAQSGSYPSEITVQEKRVTLSPGGQNLLIRQIIEGVCPRFAPGATVCLHRRRRRVKFLHLEAAYLESLGVVNCAVSEDARCRRA